MPSTFTLVNASSGIAAFPAGLQNYPPAAGAALAAMSAKLAPLNAQYGLATLAAGVCTVTGVALTASSVIMVGLNTPGGTIGAQYKVAAAGRNTTTGQFVITSIAADKTTNTDDTSTLDFLILG